MPPLAMAPCEIPFDSDKSKSSKEIHGFVRKSTPLRVRHIFWPTPSPADVSPRRCQQKELSTSGRFFLLSITPPQDEGNDKMTCNTEAT
jgi:hypothetical protein